MGSLKGGTAPPFFHIRKLTASLPQSAAPTALSSEEAYIFNILYDACAVNSLGDMP